MGTKDNGCNMVRIIGWIDGLNAICDETVGFQQNDNYYGHYISLHNALMNKNNKNAMDSDSNNDAMQVFDKMDVSLQAVLIFVGIGICCGMLWVFLICCFGLCYEFIDDVDDKLHHKKNYKTKRVRYGFCWIKKTFTRKTKRI